MIGSELLASARSACRPDLTRLIIFLRVTQGSTLLLLFAANAAFVRSEISRRSFSVSVG
jgi:hypothetical protein